MALLRNFYQGDTQDLVFLLRDETQSPISVAGAALVLTIKSKGDDSENDEAAVIKKEQMGVETDTENPTGEILLSLEHDDTLKPPGKYKYDLKLIRFINGIKKVTTLDSDVVEIYESVTKEV
ncbi:hypothetical protein [Desulfobacter sp.]|uniref:hypothetical protein n=1 Tax=Desulfobacter sp. TaxID=2294 RepID=UPI003D0B5EEF